MADARLEFTTNDSCPADDAMRQGFINSPLGYWLKVDQPLAQTKPQNTRLPCAFVRFLRSSHPSGIGVPSVPPPASSLV